MNKYKKVRDSVVKSDLIHVEKIALAIVSSGRSYDESSRVTGVNVERIMDLWTKFVVNEAKK
jgi:hypothetical protein